MFTAFHFINVCGYTAGWRLSSVIFIPVVLSRGFDSVGVVSGAP